MSKRCSPGVLRRLPPAMETGGQPLDPPTGKSRVVRAEQLLGKRTSPRL